jgi:hypothetical protein
MLAQLQGVFMEPTRLRYVLILISLALIPSTLLSAIDEKKIAGGITGAIAFPFLCFIFLDKNGIELLVFGLIGFGLGKLAGFLSSMIRNGMRGKGHSAGPSFIGGFGGGRTGHPGGIILSDEERKNMRK